jgi:hypothetical protein
MNVSDQLKAKQMNMQRREELTNLNPDERKRRLKEGLQVLREQREAEARLRDRQTWLSELSKECEAIDVDDSHLTMWIRGKAYKATLIEESEHVFDWMADYFPHGSTIWWWEVEEKKVINLPDSIGDDLITPLEELANYLGARDEDIVYVLSHGDYGYGYYKVAFEMTFFTCKSIFDLLWRLAPQEKYIASLESGWLMEFDPFNDECCGAKAGV